MSTESEVILARYKAVEKEPDSLGRMIGVRRLKPSELTKITGMTQELAGHDEVTAPDGSRVHIPQRMNLLVAAAVCLINESPIPFPRNRAELDAVLDRLDKEGMMAAGTAYARLVDADSPVTGNGVEEAAKN